MKCQEKCRIFAKNIPSLLGMRIPDFVRMKFRLFLTLLKHENAIIGQKIEKIRVF